MRFLAAVFFWSVIQMSIGWASPFAGNTVDDMFTVKVISENEALLEGKAKNLKAGDLLYFPRAPFRFAIKSIQGNRITITIPENSDLMVGNTLVRNQTEAMKKTEKTESALKSALHD